jgi:hypothetical protein
MPVRPRSGALMIKTSLIVLCGVGAVGCVAPSKNTPFEEAPSSFTVIESRPVDGAHTKLTIIDDTLHKNICYTTYSNDAISCVPYHFP